MCICPYNRWETGLLFYLFYSVERNGSGVELRILDYEYQVSNHWAIFYTIHCSSSLTCINEYLAIDSGGYVYEQPTRINCSIWLNASKEAEMVSE